MPENFCNATSCLCSDAFSFNNFSFCKVNSSSDAIYCFLTFILSAKMLDMRLRYLFSISPSDSSKTVQALHAVDGSKAHTSNCLNSVWLMRSFNLTYFICSLNSIKYNTQFPRYIIIIANMT